MLSHSLLPPAKEFWGKVIFSVACAKNSVHRGGPGPGGMPGPWGVPGLGGCLGPGGCVETPQDGYCGGRYASYWNAFLLFQYILSPGKHLPHIKIT